MNMNRTWYLALAVLSLSLAFGALAGSTAGAQGAAAAPATQSSAGRGMLAPLGGPAATESQSAAVEWFKLKPGAAQYWELAADPSDKLRFTITATAPELRGLPEKRVLALFTKPSSGYDTALSKMLEIFYQKQTAATVTGINFENKPERGLEVLAGITPDRYDLVITLGSDATAFAFKNYKGGPVPVVSVNAKDPVLRGQMPDYQSGSGTNFAFTSLDIPIEIQMAYLQQLRKGIKNIAVMYAESNASAKETQVLPLKAAAKARGIEVIDVVVQDNKQAKQELEAKVPQAVERMLASDPEGTSSVFWITGSTEVYNEIATIARTAGRIPVLSVVPDVVQEGDDSAVLSIGVSFESNAYLAGLYATDILAGKVRAGDLKVGVVSPPDIAISFRKAGQVGLKVPFTFFETATFVYDHDGKVIRKDGQTVAR